MAGTRFPESMARLEDVLIDALKNRLGDAVDGFVVSESRDQPTPWLTLEFRVYDYLPVVYIYDRGRGGFSVDYGSRRIGTKVPQPPPASAAPATSRRWSIASPTPPGCGFPTSSSTLAAGDRSNVHLHELRGQIRQTREFRGECRR